jgi:ATP-binding cassette subfamily B protein
VVERLDAGVETALGEGGGLVSGGEGQRIRLARGMTRAGVGLVVMDEPFRGLDRATRRKLLSRARTFWSGATVLCITHDVSETLGFERVLVMQEGKIVEQGVPADLAAEPGSRYRAMLDSEEQVRRGLWQGANWRRWEINEGQLFEDRDE